MSHTASKWWQWRGATILTALLVGAATSIFMAGSGCNHEIILNDCPDAGASDGGDTGDGGLDTTGC